LGLPLRPSAPAWRTDRDGIPQARSHLDILEEAFVTALPESSAAVERVLNLREEILELERGLRETVLFVQASYGEPVVVPETLENPTEDNTRWAEMAKDAVERLKEVMKK
jgi:hypothetical protein